MQIPFVKIKAALVYSKFITYYSCCFGEQLGDLFYRLLLLFPDSVGVHEHMKLGYSKKSQYSGSHTAKALTCSGYLVSILVLIRIQM